AQVPPALVVDVPVERVVRRKEVEELPLPSVRRVPVAGGVVVAAEEADLPAAAQGVADDRRRGSRPQVVAVELAALDGSLDREIEGAEVILAAHAVGVDRG